MAHAMMRTTAMAALLSLPLTVGMAFAQQTPDSGPVRSPAGDAAGAQRQTAQDDARGSMARESDALVATVGATEIRGSDIMSAIGMLPPRLQSQSPQMLVPVALDQLILREVILEQARAEDLAEDPEVAELVEGATRGAEDDALIHVWLERELADAVNEEAVRDVR